MRKFFVVRQIRGRQTYVTGNFTFRYEKRMAKKFDTWLEARQFCTTMKKYISVDAHKKLRVVEMEV